MNFKTITLLAIFAALGSIPGIAQYSSSSSHYSPIPVSQENIFRVNGGLRLDPFRSTGLESQIIFGITSGLEIGLGLHGGFTQGPVSGSLGGDAMLRYLTHINHFFVGLQAQGGLTYTGIGDRTIEPDYAVSLPITFSLILGTETVNGTHFYLAPAMELGQTMLAGDVVWKNGVGWRLTMGTAIPLCESLSYFIEIQPTLANGSFQLGSSTGIMFDF